ncbi:SDR family NAD(P)-dependent oxidoreductase [Parasphingorhabdus sp.]|uniref:SDR family NAD(P)-dependent oxidoreductase n=1 Tax=Parasphingorhabdus sp. TaxID=2709688 RepID=UPI0032658D88
MTHAADQTRADDRYVVNALTGQRAVITGAAGGIGEATARAFAAAGVKLALIDIEGSRLSSLAEILRSQGAEVHIFDVDISNAQQVNEAVEGASTALGGIDILVHSAGIGVESLFVDTTDEQWQRILDVDLTGSFLVLRAVARIMAVARYGRIITISSTAGVRGGTRRAAYGAAKAGVIMLTRVLAVELADQGITANCLAPGAIETELVQEMHSLETRTTYRAAIPADRYGTPDDVAHAALFLASPRSGYVNGHILAVDGGFLAAGLIIR